MSCSLRSLLCFAACLLCAVGSSVVYAQEVATSAPSSSADTEPEAIELEAFTVTGSNLRRLEGETTLPVTRIDLDTIDVRDASQAADLLAALPQVTGLPGNETATLGATARGDNSTVALRGIPSSNTLILLNGRRLVPHAISQSEAGVPTLSVNANQLPNQGLDRVEVLRDGASSIYGTDAVAGVINYVTQHDFKGTELRLRFAETEIGDGREIRGTLTQGIQFADGRGRGVFVLDVYQRDEILARNRDFMVESDHSSRAPEPWNVSTNTSFNARSATSEYGNFELGTVNASGVFTAGRRPGIPSSLVASSGRFFLVPTETGVGFRTTTPSRTGITSTYYWNNNTYRVLQPDSERVNAFLNGEFRFNRRLTAFGELSLYRARSLTFREPDGITQSTDGNIIVPVDSPWNPFGSRFWHPTGQANADGTPRLTGTPGVVRISNKRLTDLADRTARIDNRILRGVVGLRGKLGESWTWESAVLRSESRVEDNESGPSRKSLLKEAINQTDPALAFNPFTRTFAVQGNTLVVTGDYQNPESVQETFRSSFLREGRTGLSSIDFGASGDLFDLWGGNRVGLAFGGEYRYETYSDQRPPFAGLNPPDSGLDPESNDFLGFSPNSDTDGNRHVAALYVETVLPLVGGKFQLPLVHAFEVSASARFESYTDFGDTTKPKFGATWRTTSWMLVRASYNEGFKAPNLAQLFTGTLIRTVTGSNDTYRSPVTGLPIDGPSNRRRVASGNPDLQPEESRGKSAGVVVDVPFVKGLSLGVDYWEIRQKDVIAISGSIADDTGALLAATAAALDAGQSIDAIDLGSGTAAYQGDPSVVRLPVTQTDRDFFAAYNATRAPGNQRAVVGGIDFLRSTYFNRARQFVNGFDFDATWRLPETRFGRITVNTAWTYLNDFHAYNSAGASRTELRWVNSSAVAGASTKWRGNASVTWRKDAWRAGVSAYYIGDYSDSGATTTAATYETLGQPDWIAPVVTNGTTVYRYVVPDSISYNAHVSYTFRNRDTGWLNNTTIRLGVINLFDRIPPLSSDSRGYDPSLYNQMARGRSWNLQITKRL